MIDLRPQKPIPERFPPPGTVVEYDVGIRVCVAEGKWVTWVYCEDEEVRRSILRLPTWQEARSIAAVVARLPELIERGST